MKARYRGFFGRTARRRCPHSRLAGIYGDPINHCGGWRLWCHDCWMHLDGPVDLAVARDDLLDDDGMCDNCVTPWKCNGPHEGD